MWESVNQHPGECRCKTRKSSVPPAGSCSRSTWRSKRAFAPSDTTRRSGAPTAGGTDPAASRRSRTTADGGTGASPSRPGRSNAAGTERSGEGAETTGLKDPGLDGSPSRFPRPMPVSEFTIPIGGAVHSSSGRRSRPARGFFDPLPIGPPGTFGSDSGERGTRCSESHAPPRPAFPARLSPAPSGGRRRPPVSPKPPDLKGLARILNEPSSLQRQGSSREAVVAVHRERLLTQPMRRTRLARRVSNAENAHQACGGISSPETMAPGSSQRMDLAGEIKQPSALLMQCSG